MDNKTNPDTGHTGASGCDTGTAAEDGSNNHDGLPFAEPAQPRPVG